MDSAKAFFTRGVEQSCQGDYAGAVASFDRALQFNPDDAATYGHRCVARYQVGDWQGAIADCQSAAQLYLEQGNVKDYQYALKMLGKLQK